MVKSEVEQVTAEKEEQGRGEAEADPDGGRDSASCCVHFPASNLSTPNFTHFIRRQSGRQRNT